MSKKVLKPKALTKAEKQLILDTPYDAIPKIFGYEGSNRTRRWLMAERDALRAAVQVKEPTPDELRKKIQERHAIKQKDSEHKNTKKELEFAQHHIKMLETSLAVSEHLDDAALYPRVIAPPVNNRKSKHLVMPWMAASDHHCEEIIEPSKVYGLNEFNLKIAGERSDRLYTNFVKMIQRTAVHADIENVGIWLGGDFISGDIHTDIIAGAECGPMDALMKFADMAISGISYVLDKTPYKMVIVCSVGNHARTTGKDIRIATAHETNSEWLTYHWLQRFLDAKYPGRITWSIPRSYLAYVDVYEGVLRFHHGNRIKSMGGIGGLQIPLMKFMLRADQTKRSDVDIIGHFHDFESSSRRAIVNGCLNGYSPFAENFALKNQPPVQAYFVWDARYDSLTEVSPIFVG